MGRGKMTLPVRRIEGMATVQEVNLEPEVDLDLIYSTPANGAWRPAAPADDGLGALGAFACCGATRAARGDAPCADDSAVLDDWDLAPAKDDEELLRRIWDDLNDEALRRVWRETGGGRPRARRALFWPHQPLPRAARAARAPTPRGLAPPRSMRARRRGSRAARGRRRAASPLFVTVPRGAEPGRSLARRLSDGRALKVAVPEARRAGRAAGGRRAPGAGFAGAAARRKTRCTRSSYRRQRRRNPRRGPISRDLQQRPMAAA